MNTTTTDAFGNVRCTECQRFASPSDLEKGRSIKHANYCESKAQPSVPGRTSASELAKIVRAAKAGAFAAVLSDDEIVDAVGRKLISSDDAMNRDF